ncbi:MAG: helix-turn-helix domain-containing protein [Henriciella sp.]
MPARKHFSPSEIVAVDQPAIHVRDSVGLLFDTTPLKSRLNKGTHSRLHWIAEDCSFLHIETDAAAIRRTKAQSMNGEHLLFVHRYLSGFLRGRLGDLNVDRDPGSIYVLDMAKRVETVQRRYRQQGIFITKSALGFDNDNHPAMMKFPSDRSVGRLLDTLFNDLFRDLLQNNAIEAAKLEQTKACLKIAMGANVRDGDIRHHFRAALRDTICSYIERNIEHEDLSVGSILKEFGVSRASLYRMFDDRGGVREFITSRRLLSAVLDLSNGPVLRGDIAMTAEKWGFMTSGNFNRAVRREYGVAPGSLVDLPKQDRNKLSPWSAPLDFQRALQNSFSRITQSKIRLPA